MNDIDEERGDESAVASVVVEELRYLRSLFERRLVEDKNRERAVKELYEQLEFARHGLVEQFLLPIISEILVTCDRLEREAHDNESLYAVVDEILEAFRRRGLHEIEWEGYYEPDCQEVAGIARVYRADEDRTNVDIDRRGYRFGDRIVRPARVIIGRYEEAHAPLDAL